MRERCLTAGQVWNPARVDGIYSIGTMATYRKECIAFAEWAKERHGCRWLDECREHVSEYLRERVGRGDSPWTLQMVRSALRKLYRDPELAKDVELPIRHKNRVARSRGEKPMDREFSEERNRDLVDFCRATGLRRHELAALRVGDVYERDGKTYVHVEQGKGGRSREVPVLEKYRERVQGIVYGRGDHERVFDRIPVRADVHGYRRDYARERYRELTGREYDRNNRDRAAIREISQNLGHNREDVVTRSYL
jgi:site-specific recombinase XerD